MGIEGKREKIIIVMKREEQKGKGMEGQEQKRNFKDWLHMKFVLQDTQDLIFYTVGQLHVHL